MATTYYDRLAQNRALGDSITAARLQELNVDLDMLFQRLNDSDLTINYDLQKRLSTVVDNINSITLSFNRLNRTVSPGYFEITEVSTTNVRRVNYNASGILSSIIKL